MPPPSSTEPRFSVTWDGHLEADRLEISYPTLLSSQEMSASSKQAACNLGLHKLQGEGDGGVTKYQGVTRETYPGQRTDRLPQGTQRYL